MPNSHPFGPAITRTYASPAAQPHRCCSLSRHRRLPGCLCVQAHRAGQTLLLLFGLLALVAHAFSLYQQLLTPAGLVLDFFNAASLIAAAVILLTLLATLRIPVENLLLLLFPLGPHHPAGGTHPHGTVEPINEQPGILAHILLSILAYGLLTIAVFQALLLLLRITASSTSIRPG